MFPVTSRLSDTSSRNDGQHAYGFRSSTVPMSSIAVRRSLLRSLLEKFVKLFSTFLTFLQVFVSWATTWHALVLDIIILSSTLWLLTRWCVSSSVMRSRRDFSGLNSTKRSPQNTLGILHFILRSKELRSRPVEVGVARMEPPRPVSWCAFRAHLSRTSALYVPPGHYIWQYLWEHRSAFFYSLFSLFFSQLSPSSWQRL